MTCVKIGMRRLIILSVFVLLSVVVGTALAEDAQETADIWYPYDIKITDDYSDVVQKVSEVLTDQPCNIRTNYVQFLPEGYYLYDLPVNDLSVMNRKSYWRVVFFADVPQTETDLENVYKFYAALVEKLGEPIESSPTEVHATFDGKEEISVLESKDSFLSSALSADYGTTYEAEFEYLGFEVNIWDDVQVIVSFDNEMGD